jgi:hypothetical protein
MPYDKVPRNYDPDAFQKIIDGMQRAQRAAEKRGQRDAIDVARGTRKALKALYRKVTGQDGTDDAGFAEPPITLPAPQKLNIFELGLWGWATINPFVDWKYWNKIRGYQFFGSQNEWFAPQEDDYTETGTFIEQDDPPVTHVGQHWGNGTVGDEDEYLLTENTDDQSDTFILHPGLVGKVLENSTRSQRGKIDALETNKLKDSTTDFTSTLITVGMPVQNVALNTFTTVLTISNGELTLNDDIFTRIGEQYLVGAGEIPLVGGYNLFDVKHRVKTAGLGWVRGDNWRIFEYPANKLPCVGALATFVKRAGNFYVRARTVGRDNNFSDFNPPLNEDPDQSSGITSSEDLETPVFVDPIHSDGKDCPIELDDGDPDYGKPIHPTLGAVPWTDIVGGCRETDHYKFFGFEWCHVELVYNTIPEDDDDLDVFYKVIRTGALWGSPTVDEDEEEGEYS